MTGETDTTTGLSEASTSEEVSDALGSLATGTRVLVSRHDHSSGSGVSDATGSDTAATQVVFQVTFIDANPDGITASGSAALHVGAAGDGTVPTALYPSRPANALSTVISSTQIGVWWEPPAYSDGTVSKYLVEWGLDSGFSSPSQYVTTNTQYQINGLDPDSEYWVRISAYQSGADPTTSGYGPPAVAPPLVTADQVPHVPTAVSMAVSGGAHSDQLDFTWSAPVTDHATEQFETADGGSEVSHYVFEYEGFYVWGVGESSFPIVGDVALNEMVVVFDQSENKVGFGVATCYSDDDDASASSSSTHSSHSSHSHSPRTRLRRYSATPVGSPRSTAAAGAKENGSKNVLFSNNKANTKLSQKAFTDSENIVLLPMA